MPGPKRTPAKTLNKRGSKRTKPRTEARVDRAAGIPEIPAELDAVLDGDARTHWEYITEKLGAEGVISEVDLMVLAEYCFAYADVIELVADVKENGRSFTTPNGYEQIRPEAAELKQTRARLISLAKELGLTPTSRSKTDTLTDTRAKTAGEKRRKSFFGEAE